MMYFLGSENQERINCEHVIVQRVVSLFFRLNFNKLYPISVTKIVEMTYVTSGTFQNMIVQGICRKKSEQRARS